MTSEPVRVDSVDLTNCDREPIHTPGSIQTSGVLLACDAECARIQRFSRGAGALLDWADESLIGANLADVVGPRLTHDLRNALTTATDPARPGLIFRASLPNGTAADVAVHSYKGVVIIELERSPGETEASPLDVARRLISRLKKAPSEQSLIQTASRLCRSLLGYDRVMVYRFAHDGSGKVVSEARRSGLESFLGQHFPASDIPQQARRLYLQNTIRIIADAKGDRVPIIPEIDQSGEPLDLSFAHLRSVSPIHCEYLNNMGVRASMSVSVIVQGELWGLIACHHYAPRALSMTERVAAELFGDFFSLHLEAIVQQEKLAHATRARKSLDDLLRDIAQEPELRTALAGRIDGFAQMFDVDGVALWVDQRWSASGSTPPAQAAEDIARFLSSVTDGQVYATHALSQRLPAAAAYKNQASGLLAVPLSRRRRDYLLFFRKEVIQTVDWAGDPTKTYQTGKHGDRLTPRTSFAIWRQTVEGQSIPWSAADREMAESTRAALVEIILRNSELLQEERANADVRQRMLNQELNHRVKNILSLIKSLIALPSDRGKSVRDYVDGLQGRIHALSHAHDQIMRGAGGGALTSLLEAELSPYRHGNRSVRLEGPPLMLDARAYSVMALVLHELATNAAKYGALSVEGGSLDVVWTRHADGCEIVWTERGKPISRPPTRVGFGTKLIERSLPFDLGGRSTVEYRPQGLHVAMFLPLEHVSFQSAREPSSDTTPVHSGGAVHPVLTGKTVLLVEDQMLIAMDAESILMDAGASHVETANSVESALASLRIVTPDVAVLDVNLGSLLSIPVAEQLRDRGIPFVFATGYGDMSLIPGTFAAIQVVRKPYDSDGLVGAIGRALDDGAAEAQA